MDNITTLTGDKILIGRMIAQRGAMRLEEAGMRRSGRSVTAQVKEMYGFRGSRKKVIEQLSQKIKEEMANL